MAGKMAASVALKAIAMGAPYIPDKVFESIPGGYFKAKNQGIDRKKQKKTDRRGPRRSRRDSYSPDEDYYSDYYTSDDEDRHRERCRLDRRDRQYRAQSVGGERRDYDQGSWDPERGFDRSNRDSTRPPQDYDPCMPRPYNPADYSAPPSAAMGVAAAHKGSNGRRDSQEPLHSAADFYGRYNGERRPSTAELRYRPVNYTPSNPSSYAPPQSTPSPSPYSPTPSTTVPPVNLYSYNSAAYTPGVYGQPGHYAAPPPLFRQPSHSQPASRSNSRHGSKSGHHRTSSVPRSISAVRDRLHNMDDEQRKLAASAVGALAGGLLGHEIINSDVGTAVGAAIGGLALRGWEKRQEEKHKDDKRGRDHGSRYDHINGHRPDGFEPAVNDNARRHCHGHRHHKDDFNGYDSF